MKLTNYSKIAQKYEKNQYRKDEIRYDDDLKAYIDRNCKSGYDVLDLSCGTGLYLDKQMNAFKEKNIKWTGLDASTDMLDIAKGKLENVSLIKAYAEDMPFQSETFDFISNYYALHHYRNKSQALDEIYRVLIKGGIYKLHNIAIHDMPKWWVYYYFPSTWYEDLKRFWNKEVIFHELTVRGFHVKLHIDYQMFEIKVAELMDYAVNRDISVLMLIDDDDYEEGLERMTYDFKKNPHQTVVNDFAEMFCVAKKE